MVLTIMRKQKNVVFLCLLMLVILTSCAESPSTHEYYSSFQSCRGFDFDKKFPGKCNCPDAVHYDDSLKRLYGVDGLYFGLEYYKNIKDPYYYNYKDLELSTQEKEYIANFDKLEEEFDRKYAGEIKKKLRSVSKAFTRPNGKAALQYPRYLKEEALPDGVVAPVSIFTYGIIRRFIEAKKHPGDLRDFILSTELYKDFDILDLAAGVGSNAVNQVSWRLESLYAEYVLTKYYLKAYGSLEQRHQIAIDLAEYYSEVAFRGAAESLYHYNHILTSGQRCRIANYIAGRMYKLVMVIDDLEHLKDIKREYEKELFNACYSSLLNQRYLSDFHNGKISEKKAIELRDNLKNRMESGEERCIND